MVCNEVESGREMTQQRARERIFVIENNEEMNFPYKHVLSEEVVCCM